MVVRMDCKWAVEREPAGAEKSVAAWVIFAAHETAVLKERYRLAARKVHYLVGRKVVPMERWKVGQKGSVISVELMVVH